MNYDYSILTGYFPESVIEEFRASAIAPKLCLLNAEFLNGDKAISELLGEVKIHNNNGTLRGCLKSQERVKFYAKRLTMIRIIAK
ncbi:hypothetical protein, partial [Chamaesiphon polymorphus]